MEKGNSVLTRLTASICAATILAGAAFTPAFAARSGAGVSLTGAGSSFDFPFFDKAFSVYNSKYGVSVNYQPKGSGAGIAQFTQKLVNFGATDVPMNPTSELPAAVRAGGPVQQIPVALGGISIAYNIPGVKTGLHLDGSTLAKIYLGTITNWKDAAIKKLNKKVKLPDLAITVVHRSDGSGTSFAFTNYLSKISSQWNGYVGTGKLPNWPVGVGGQANLGVAQLVQQTSGAIGYVELAYVLQQHMHQAMIENVRHQFELPSPKTVAADAASFKKVSAANFSIVNGRGKNAYPISTYSWLLIYKHQTDATTGKALVKLTEWLVTTGQKYAAKLEYVALPKTVQQIGLSAAKQVSF